MRHGNEKHRVRVTLLLLMSNIGCTLLIPWREQVAPALEWPSPKALETVQPLASDDTAELNGQAALVAAAALQETFSLWSDQHLFEGCPAPALGLGAMVYPWKEHYFVHITQRFDRCGGKRFRMLDWEEAFLVSSEGRVLARRPQGP